jgi:hypothetical protein
MFNYNDRTKHSGLSKRLLQELGTLKLDEDLNKQEKLVRLFCFSKVCDLIGDLSWQEHTGDWDPYLEIDLKDGSRIDTCLGFSQFEIKGTDKNTTICVDWEKLNEIEVLDCEWEGNEEFIRTIKVEDIKEIRLVY